MLLLGGVPLLGIIRYPREHVNVFFTFFLNMHIRLLSDSEILFIQLAWLGCPCLQGYSIAMAPSFKVTQLLWLPVLRLLNCVPLGPQKVPFCVPKLSGKYVVAIYPSIDVNSKQLNEL